MARSTRATSGGTLGAMSELVPPPQDIADLVSRMTAAPWPTTEDDWRSSFTRLGLRDDDVRQHVNPDAGEFDTTNHWFRADLPGDVTGSSTMFRSELVGLGLFAYDDRTERAGSAVAGYVQLAEQFTRLFSRPVEEWGTAHEPAGLWRAEPLQLEMYCHQRPPSGVQLGLSHIARTAVFEAYVADSQTHR